MAAKGPPGGRPLLALVFQLPYFSRLNAALENRSMREFEHGIGRLLGLFDLRGERSLADKITWTPEGRGTADTRYHSRARVEDAAQAMI